MKNLDGEAGVLAVLDELAEVWEAVLLGLRVLLDDGNDGVRDARLVVQPPLIPITKKMNFFNVYKLWQGERSVVSCLSGNQKPTVRFPLDITEDVREQDKLTAVW